MQKCEESEEKMIRYRGEGSVPICMSSDTGHI